jgi:predicted nucleic acid-binding protein
MYLFDGCVAIKWMLKEEDTERALKEAVRRQHEIVAPSLAVIEVQNAIWKLLRKGDMLSADAQLACKRVPDLFTKIVPLEQLWYRASEIMIALIHPIYDCVYLALAEQQRLPLVTVDQRLIDAGSKLGSVKVIHLRDL